VEDKIEKLNRIKIDLLKISQCIEHCSSEDEKDMYQNIAIEYSKEIKKVKSAIEKTYDIKIFCCQSIEK
jgi:hypothetical protein